MQRLTQPNGIRLAPYVRLLIEPLFAFNHFEDEEGAQLIDDEEYGSESSDDDKKEIKIKTKKKGNKQQTSIKMKVDMQDPGAIDKLQKHLEDHVKDLVAKVADKKPSGGDPGDDDDSDFVSDNGSED